MKRVILISIACVLGTAPAPAQSETTPQGMPVLGATKKDITARYGMRHHPVLEVDRMHTGIDIKAPVGTGVLCTADGTVTEVTENAAEGKVIRLRHQNGFQTKYSHLDRVSVRIGAKVHRGDIIGGSGRTGTVVGPHLHYEVLKDGRNVDPAPFLTSG